MKNIYTDKTYLKNNPSWHEEDAGHKSNEIIQLIKRNNLNFGSVCDIGCGSGEILVQLSSAFKENVKFAGFDISEDAIAIAKKKETENIRFEVKDITESLENIFFDLLLVIDVIEHLENYFAFLENISSKGKYTIFHIPLDMYVWSLFRQNILIEAKNRVGHIHNFTEEFIESILTDKGFKIIDKVYTEPSFETRSFKQSAINLIRRVLFKINRKFCTKTIGGYSILLLAKNSPQKKC